LNCIQFAAPALS